MWTEPSPTILVSGTTVTVVPTTTQGTVRPNRAILINSSPFTLIVYADNLIQQVTAWSKDVIQVDQNNPSMTITPTVSIASSIPYDTSLYVTWVDPQDQISTGYPQSITPNVLPAVPPTSGKLVGLSSTIVATVAGTSNIVPGPGAGNSIFINTVSLAGGAIGGSAFSSLLLQDGAGNILHGLIILSTGTPVNQPLNMSGFQVGDNKRLDIVVNVGAGSSSALFLATVTYSVGIKQ